MSARLERVATTLQRAVAEVLVGGGLRDPRLSQSSAISVTGVQVSPDLSHARVFVDVLAQQVDRTAVVEALNAGASAIRARVGQRIRLKRVPSLRFSVDPSIEHGRNIEAVLHQIRQDEGSPSDDGEP